MGYICNQEVKKLRIKAHDLFDGLWKRKIIIDKCSKREARNLAYKWLAKSLNISADDCHIAMFDKHLTTETIKLCSKYYK
jgi:hypothetical protein